ncbi:MAG: hypothetical protein L7S44_02140 [Flavobacteriaceae bacterium]|nr:hypothetical protein [Flavobacteriaceae bacterium]
MAMRSISGQKIHRALAIIFNALELNFNSNSSKRYASNSSLRKKAMYRLHPNKHLAEQNKYTILFKNAFSNDKIHREYLLQNRSPPSAFLLQVYIDFEMYKLNGDKSKFDNKLKRYIRDGKIGSNGLMSISKLKSIFREFQMSNDLNEYYNNYNVVLNKNLSLNNVLKKRFENAKARGNYINLSNNNNTKKTEANRKAKAEANRKAKEEAKRKPKEEANRRDYISKLNYILKNSLGALSYKGKLVGRFKINNPKTYKFRPKYKKLKNDYNSSRERIYKNMTSYDHTKLTGKNLNKYKRVYDAYNKEAKKEATHRYLRNGAARLMKTRTLSEYLITARNILTNPPQNVSTNINDMRILYGYTGLLITTLTLNKLNKINNDSEEANRIYRWAKDFFSNSDFNYIKRRLKIRKNYRASGKLR